jgi:hypothetical protein
MTHITGTKLRNNDWYIVILCDNCSKIDKIPAHLTKNLIEAHVISGFCNQCDGIQIVNIPKNSKNMNDWIWKGIVK